MTEPTQIIVYKNPAQAMFWDSMMNRGGFMIVLAVFVAGLFWAVLYDKLAKILVRSSRFSYGLASTVAGWVSFAITVVLLYGLHWYSIRY